MTVKIELGGICVDLHPQVCDPDNRAPPNAPNPAQSSAKSSITPASSPNGSTPSNTSSSTSLSTSGPTTSSLSLPPTSLPSEAPSTGISSSKAKPSSSKPTSPASSKFNGQASFSSPFPSSSSIPYSLTLSINSTTPSETASAAAAFQTPSSSSKTNHNRVIIGSSIGAACFLFLVIAMIFLLRMRRKSVISPNEMDIGELKDSDEPATEYPSYHATHDEKLQTYATNDEEIALPFPYAQPNYASEVSLSKYSTISSPAPSIFEAVASPEIIGPIYPSRSPDPNPFHADDASSVDVAFDNEPLFLHGADPNRFKATSPTFEGNLSRSSTVKSTGGRSSLRSRITLGVAM